MTLVKVGVYGLGSVGKSCLSVRFIRDTFLEEYEPTIENTYRKTIVINNNSYVVDILDTAGMEDNKPLKAGVIRARECFILVYSIVDRQSFDHIRKIYDDIISIKETHQVPIILVGNKIDLEQDREIAVNEGQELAQQINAVFLETSAKTGHNIDKTIEQAVLEHDRFHGGPVEQKKSGLFDWCLLI